MEGFSGLGYSQNKNSFKSSINRSLLNDFLTFVNISIFSQLLLFFGKQFFVRFLWISIKIKLRLARKFSQNIYEILARFVQHLIQ